MIIFKTILGENQSVFQSTVFTYFEFQLSFFLNGYQQLHWNVEKCRLGDECVVNINSLYICPAFALY